MLELLAGCGLLLNAISYHHDTDIDFNERHKSVGIACETWSAGYFENSYSEDSAWVARRWQEEWLYFEAGAAAGYDSQGFTEAGLMPFARVGADIPFAELSIAPSWDKQSNTPLFIFMAQIEIGG